MLLITSDIDCEHLVLSDLGRDKNLTAHSFSLLSLCGANASAQTEPKSSQEQLKDCTPPTLPLTVRSVSLQDGNK